MPKSQLQKYLMLRKHIADFQKRLLEHLDRLEKGATSDLLKKYGTLLVFDFEAAIQLKKWDDLGSIVEVDG
ncbi:MAG: hypothetical protein M4579_005842 [Chaenotheca gracillima]|nr:MAG: hypothetical protein M4579_005842 [Chaenotheca gracillima]